MGQSSSWNEECRNFKEKIESACIAAKFRDCGHTHKPAWFGRISELSVLPRKFDIVMCSSFLRWGCILMFETFCSLCFLVYERRDTRCA